MRMLKHKKTLAIAAFLLPWASASLFLARAARHTPVDRLPSSIAVYDSNHRLLRLTLAGDEKYRLKTPMAKISPLLVEAVLLHEDRHYYLHPGANPVALLRAAWTTYGRGGRRIGGSTISMQLARMAYGLNTRTISGKLRQIARALALEAVYSKRQILEAYLNSAPYGRNIEGVGAASLIYFGKPSDKLTLPEALTLAVIPQSPKQRTPGHRRNQPLFDARMDLYRQWIANHPDDKRDEALMRLPIVMRDTGGLPFLAPHFVNELLPTVAASEVTSSLDIRLQRLLERHVHSYVTEERRIGINNAAAMLVDYRSMQIKALVGSADFFDGSIQGQINGTAARRSPGSALKPFLYALAIDQGLIHPLTVLKDSPLSYGGFSPENFDGQFTGPISAKEALIRSRNVPAVALASKLTNPSFYSFLKSAGVSQLKSEQHYGLGLVLGGAEVTMEEVAALYAALANDGILRPLSRTNEIPFDKGTRILSEDAAFTTMEMLKDNPRPDRGWIEAAATDSEPVYWKTGTSFGFRDAWTAGIFGPYVLVVWIGNFDNEGNPAFVGVQAAAPLFFRIVDSVRAGRNHLRGPMRTIPPQVRKIGVCAVSGQLPGPYCERLASTWFIPGKSPIKLCDVHRQVVVDDRTGLEACAPYGGATHKEVYEFWDSDMLRIFKQAGIPRRTPPARVEGCNVEALSARGNPPQITSPSNGVSYALRAFKPAERSIPFRAVTDADATEVFWFVNETYVGKAGSGKVFLWPATPGSFVVRAIDDRGRSGSRDMVVSIVQ
ncbi:MAG TPA: penicillin-binding protein 1C [Thermoanaerobaculia bacterium]|nr:penicillin-binding protein 1C [Thermoanaerobaculia bacterium]